MDKASLVKQIMAEALADDEPVTEAEAEEMAEMEIKAKGLKNYVVSDKPKERKPRKKKTDDDKRFLIQHLYSYLGNITNPNVTNTEREITFTFNGNEYSVTLTKHRPKKT